MNFLALPLETIINILGRARPIDIRRSQLVCRALRKLVTSSLYLQYILELDACGYTLPAASRPDLSYEEMRNKLREHREAWQDPSSCSTDSIEISPRTRINSTLVDGIFAYGHVWRGEQPDFLQTIDEIQFHQLRSINKGTGYKSWSHRDFGFSVEVFAIQPEIDLLVLVEGTLSTQETVKGTRFGSLRRTYKSYRLHFQTMSTNAPHFLAGSTFLETGLGGSFSRLEPLGTQLTISLNGRMIMLIASTDYSTAERMIGVWDWVRATEIARITVPMYLLNSEHRFPSCHAYLLSEEYLTVFRAPEHSIYEPAEHTTSRPTKLGHFDVYQLRSQYKPRLVAQFELPDLSADRTKTEATMFYGPASLPLTPYWLSKREYVPRIYETSPQSRMFCLLLSVLVNSPDPWGISSMKPLNFYLHIPVQALLSHLEAGCSDASNATLYAWRNWGAQLCWIETWTDSAGSFGLYTHSATMGDQLKDSDISGLRHSIYNFSFYKLFGDQKKERGDDMVAILDFDPQRIKFTRVAGQKAPKHDNHTPFAASDWADRSKFMTRLNTSHTGDPLFKTPMNFAPSYRHISLDVESLPPSDAFMTSCHISNEHRTPGIDLVYAGKRGIAWPWYNEGTNLTLSQLISVNVQWIYNWETWKPTATGSLNFIGTQRCIDCSSSPINQLYARAIGQGWKTIFTLNEPDLSVGGTSPSDAAKWYIQWINPLNITKAIPAVTSSTAVGQGLDWVDGFMTACAGQCYFDYINLHWYGASFEDFRAYIEGAHNRFPAHRLVITEFALLPPATRQDQTAFLNTAMAFLDNMTYVDYYAIFLATSPSLIVGNNGGSDYPGTTSTLFGDDGTLTLNGVAYRG